MYIGPIRGYIHIYIYIYIGFLELPAARLQVVRL